MTARVAGLGAIVLCGGRSSHMGASKARLDFGGEALLQRVVRRVSEAAWPVVVVAAVGQDVPALPPEVVLTRDPVSDRGLLQGIAAGLAALPPAPEVEAAFVCSTDVPFVHPELIRRLHALRTGEHDLVVPWVGGHPHPLSAIYARSTAREIAALLAEDRLRLSLLFDRVRTLVAGEATLLAGAKLCRADPGLRSLWNVNTPEDYRAALAGAGFR